MTRGTSLRNPVIAAMGLALLLSGCLAQLNKRTDATQAIYPNSAGGGGTAIFQAKVYPYLRTNCSACHGNAQAPKFAVADVTAAYNAAHSVVNFTDINASRLLVKGTDSHCGSGCISSNKATLLGLLEQWKAGELSAPGSATTVVSIGKIVSTALPLPAGIPVVDLSNGTNQNNFVRMRWDLSQVAPGNPDLAGAVFEVEVQQYTALTDSGPASLRFRKPRIGSPTVPLLVQGVRILADKTFNVANDQYLTIDESVSPGPIAAPTASINFPVLSPELMIVVLPNGAASPQIYVSFERLEKTTIATCKNLAGWQSMYRPIMVAKCTNCHGGGNGGATSKLNLNTTTNTDEQLCGRSLQRVDLKSPIDSPLITYPLRGASLGHPATTFNSADADTTINWIRTEK